MIGKKNFDTVIKTIKDAPGAEVNGAVLGETIFSTVNKSYLMDFVKSRVQPNTDAMRIIVELVNKNYFDSFYKHNYSKAENLARATLILYEASNEQIERFFNEITSDDDTTEDNSENVNVSEENDLQIEEDQSETESDDSEDTEQEVSIENLETNAEEESGQNVISETEEIDVSSEEIVESSEHSSEVKSGKEKSKKSFRGRFAFIVCMIIAVILFVIALKAIRPTGSDKFYEFYYVIFIVFSIGVFICCGRTQRDISLLWKFYKNFKNSRGRKEDLKSDNKAIDDICTAYKESFLLNENYNKTRSNADLYFGGETYFNDMHRLPIQSFLKIIPGTFVGFGILGTFIGFAGGLSSINIADSQSLLEGVQNLLDGLKNAFNTSIVGVLASMFLNFFMIHPLLNRLDRGAKELCDYLDTKFFVSEVDAMSVTDANNKQIPFPQTMGIVLEKLEQVASNINQMGATVGDQVTQSVKATLDKTIEKIIKEEIEKLKAEMKTSIATLQECQKHLQNAPANLKAAAEKMQAAALNNDELFRRQNQESVEILTKTIEENLNAKFSSYAKVVEETSEEMLNIKNTLSLIPGDFSNIDKSIQATTEKLSANQTTLENALSESTQAFGKTTEINESLAEVYESQSEKIEEMVSKFTDVLTEYKETSKESKELLAGFKGMDEQIAKIFEQINENTSKYSEIIGSSLSKYLENFSNATNGVSKKFADATDALREEIEKLNKTTKSGK